MPTSTHRSYVLTDAQVAGIRALYHAGKRVTQKELATVAGVHESTMSDYITDKIRKPIQGQNAGEQQERSE